MNDTPAHNPTLEFVSSIAADIIFTLITCGIYNLFVQNRQIKALNYILGGNKYSFIKWLLLTICTCGIYHVYHQYILSKDLDGSTGKQNPNLPLISLLLTLFGMTMLADAFIQNVINEYFGARHAT